MKSILLAAALLLSMSAQAASSEDRLREQLRVTAGRVHASEEQASHALAEKQAAEQQRDALQKELDETRSTLAALRKSSSEALEKEHTQREQASTDLTATRAELAKTTALARGTEGERARLDGELKARSSSLEQCVAANQQLYDTGHEILGAYERVGLGDVIATREPFIGAKRVELENLAGKMGDRLHEGRYDPRMAAAPVPAPATAAPVAQP